MRTNLRQIGWAVILLIAAISPVLANSGSVLFQLTGFQLLIGNFFIGLLEGRLAERVLEKRYGVAVSVVGWMTAANYASMLVGWVGLGLVVAGGMTHLGSRPIANLPWLVAATLLIAFLASVLIEWAFLHAGTVVEVKLTTTTVTGLPSPRGWTIVFRWLLFSVLILLALQFARPYMWVILPVWAVALLITLFYERIVSFHRIMRDTPLPGDMAARLPRRTFTANLLAQLASYAILIPLYLSASGMTLLTGVHRERNLDFVKSPQAVVYYQPLSGEGYRRVRLDGSAPERVKMTKAEFERMVTTHYDASLVPGVIIALKQYPKGEAVDLRPRGTRGARVRYGYSAWTGLSVEHPATGQSYHIGLDMPLFEWRALSATILPGDQVVYQVGDCLAVFDTHTRQIADLGPGRRPVVFLPEER